MSFYKTFTHIKREHCKKLQHKYLQIALLYSENLKFRFLVQNDGPMSLFVESAFTVLNFISLKAEVLISKSETGGFPHVGQI